jgi:two-component system sensor histidine kinase KdpD
LAIIAGSASSLRDERARLSQAEQDQLLETLYDEAQQVSLTVSDLLEMTRLHSGRVELDRQWYPAEELVGAAIERCKRQLANHSVQTRLDPQLPLLHVDGVLIEKLLVNLLENAAKYTPAGTLVTIVGESAPGTVIIRVEDTGPGLLAGDEERIFDKFYRADRESAVTGSGLGLSICRAIAQMHSGSIRAANRPGGGAVFTVTLPAEPAPPATPS